MAKYISKPRSIEAEQFTEAMAHAYVQWFLSAHDEDDKSPPLPKGVQYSQSGGFVLARSAAGGNQPVRYGDYIVRDEHGAHVESAQEFEAVWTAADEQRAISEYNTGRILTGQILAEEFRVKRLPSSKP